MDITPEILKKRREELNLSQYDVAELAGFSQSIYAYYEKGERKPKHENALKLIEVLKLNENVVNQKFMEDLAVLREKRVIVKDKEVVDVVGLSKGNVSSYLSGSLAPSKNFLDKFYSHYGKYLETKVPDTEISKEKIGKSIPLVSIKAVGGFGSGDFSIAEQDVKDRYVIPKFQNKEVDFMIEVEGSSMYPKYNSGDVVACRIIRDSAFIQWNKTHVIATSKQGIIIKRIRESEKENALSLVSDNKDYPPFDVPKDEITGIAIVVGVFRLE